MRARAIAIAAYTPVETFIPDPNEPLDGGVDPDARDAASVETDGLGGDDGEDGSRVAPDSSGSTQF
jgi:hypothetical protein